MPSTLRNLSISTAHEAGSVICNVGATQRTRLLGHGIEGTAQRVGRAHRRTDEAVRLRARFEGTTARQVPRCARSLEQTNFRELDRQLALLC